MSERLKSFLEQDPNFQVLQEDEKQNVLVNLSKPEELTRFLGQNPDFQMLHPDEQQNVLANLSMPDNPITSRSITNEPPPRQTPMFTEPEPSTEPAGILETAEAMGKNAIGGIMSGAGGVLQSGGELLENQLGISSPVDEAGNVLAEAGESYQREAYPIRQQFGSIGKFAFDVGSELMVKIPEVLSGSWFLSAVSMGARAYGNKYRQAKQAGYSPEAAAGIGALSGTAEAVGEAITLGEAMDLSRGVLSALIRASIKEAAGEATTEVLDITTNAILDELYATDKSHRPLLDREMSWENALYHAGQVVRAGAMGGVLGAGMAGMNSVQARVFEETEMKPRGQALAESSNGYAAVVPITVKNDIEKAMDSSGQTFESDEDVAKFAEAYIQTNYDIPTEEEIQKKLSEEVFLGEDDNTSGNPIAAYKERIRPMLAETQPAGTLTTGSRVSVLTSGNPYIHQVSGPAAVELLGAKIISADDAKQTATVQLDAGGVAIQNMPYSYIYTTHPSLDTYIRQPGAPESPQMIRALWRLFAPVTKKYSEMTPDQRKVFLGGPIKVIEQAIAKGKEHSAFAFWHSGLLSKAGGVKLTWDLFAENPDRAFRILAHEIGHAIDLTKPEVLQEMGLKPFIPLRTFMQNVRAKVKKGNQLDIELDKIWNFWSPASIKLPSRSRDERVATAVAMFLNRPDGFPYQGMKLYQLWQDFLATEPKIRDFVNTLDTPLNIRQHVSDMFARASEAEKTAHLASIGARSTWWEKFATNVLDTRATWMLRLRPIMPRNEYIKLVNSQDNQLMASTDRQFHMTRVLSNIYGEKLDAAGVTQKQRSQYQLFRRILTTRKRTETFEVGSHADIENRRQTIKAIADAEADGEVAMGRISATERKTRAKQIFDELWDETLARREVKLWNPGALSYADAEKGMAELTAAIGADAIETLNRLQEEYHRERVRFILNPLLDEGLISQKLHELMVTSPDYVTFAVARHLAYKSAKQSGSNAGKAILKQLGTIADVVDPLAATISHDLLMHAVLEKNRGIRTLLEAGAKYFTDPVTKANEWVIREDPKNKFAKVPVWAEPVRVTEKGGQTVTYYVAKELMDAINGPAYGALSIPGSSYLASWMTAFSVGFGLVNPIRDLFNSMRNLPGWSAIWKIPVNFVQALPDAFNYAFRGKIDSQRIKDLFQHRLLISSMTSYYDIDHNAEALDRHLQIVGNTKPQLAKVHGMLGAMAAHASYLYNTLKWTVGNVVRTTEAASKSAAWEYLNQPGMNKLTMDEKLQLVRTQAGTPMLLRKGKMAPALGQIILFLNAFIQGTRGSIAAAKERPFEYFAKTVITQSPLRMFALLALSGALDVTLGNEDKKWQQLFRRIPLYQLMSYLILPFGLTSDGKAAYATIPLDPQGQVMGALFMNAGLALFDPEFPKSIAIQQGLESTHGTLPSLNPILKLAVDLKDLAAGRSPRDDYRGMDVVQKDMIDAGEWGSIAKALTSYYLFNQGFGGPLNNIIRIPFEAPNPSIRNPRGTTENKILEYLSDVTQFPLLARPTLGRFIRYSDAGIKDRQQWLTESIDRTNAIRRRGVDIILGKAGQVMTENGALPAGGAQELVNDALARCCEGGELSDAHLQAISRNPQLAGRQIMNYIQQVNGTAGAGELHRYMVEYQRAHGEKKTVALQKLLEALALKQRRIE